MHAANLFKPGHNCWRRSHAEYASVLVDCENFYRAIHNAISKARHSIFIAGWDIDSRIRLLRGEEELRSPWPSVISELLAKKAEDNPDLNVYLLRWDSSLAFFSKRELMLKQVWDQKTPDNVHCWLDDSIPMGGCQHQKIIVVDDEVAFSGGMDIAVQRWDTRHHRVLETEREDENGIYTPLHDVQSVVAGPVVEHFAELVRWRWNRVADIPAVPIRELKRDDLAAPPPTWPKAFPPLFRKIPCAIARTIPFMDDAEPSQEVRHMLLDLIARAERFIYLENQFASRQEIAEALNARLRACKGLRVLVVSSYRPKGTVECEAYWASRIDFKNILEQGVEKHRVQMLYSSAHDQEGNFGHKRIHSKVTVVDDQYLIVGSANLSNRSMTLDTECDLVFAAGNEIQQRQIAHVRNDLIGEHCGRSDQAVERILRGRKGLIKLTKPAGKYAYRLKEVEDELFTDQSWQMVMQPFSDPEEPMVPPLPLLNGRHVSVGNPRRKTVMIGTVVAISAVILGLVYLINELFPGMDADSVHAFLEKSRGTWWGLPAVCLVYVIGGITFFPVTVLSLAVAAIFGPVWGPLYGICGALLSAALLFGVGHMLGVRGLRRFGGGKVQVIDEKFRRSGIIGVAALRLLPIAPYSLVNLVAGISSIGLLQFMGGTFLGMFPTMIAKGLVGDSLVQVFINPTPLSITYLVAGISVWVGVAVISQKLVNRYQRRRSG
ncbi:VTT domain-containing protein [Gilvimarinus sp. F26214L]|uniref:VTT domain-containing protein n=1 Tax=Gilvimarinus sp. DZF01 TaxID=3461371 RepID=UPI0040458FAF